MAPDGAQASSERPRPGLEGLLGDLERLELIFETWDETPRAAVAAWGRATDALHAEAFRRLVAALKREPAALEALKGALGDEVIYAVLRKLQIVRPSLTERVEAALARVRPMLATHGGDVELVAIEPPAVHVRFTGACDGCPASQVTFHEGVKKALAEACPELSQVVQVKGSLGAQGRAPVHSPFASARPWHLAARLEELPDGGVRGVLVAGQKLLLARRGAAVTCFANACAHLGFPLHDGEVVDGVLECPHHAFRYDLATGECLSVPTVQLNPHPVRVVDGNVEVQEVR